MSWDTITDRIDEYAAFARPVAASLRPHLFLLPGPVRIYANPLTRKVAFDIQTDLPVAYLRKLAKCSALPVQKMPITAEEARQDSWIKVAESRPLREGLEALQFLPSTTGIPNAPSPLAAMIASGLLGTGLGYGAGSLVASKTPDGWDKKRLRRNGALMGGLLGAAPGALWALTNHANGHSMTDGWPGVQEPIEPVPSVVPFHQTPHVPIPKVAMDTIGYEGAEPAQSNPGDINVNALGQTLWQGQAPAPITGATMGVMHAAQQFPDDNATPGWVTANQLGQLAMAAGQGYVMGKVVGKALNIATGMPDKSWGNYGAAVGIVNLALPKLFG